MICFWQGHAVSENRRLAPGQGRWFTSDDYRAFKESLGWAILPHVEQFPGPVSVRLTMVLNARMDATNIIKPVLDALQTTGVVKNDSQVRQLHVVRENAKPKQGDWLCIMVTEV